MQGNEKTTRRRAGARQRLKVVLFSGGRGSRVLSRELVSNPRVDLVIAVNGYDDGKSTGEVRRFVGECLGPSDFRKNGARLAGHLGTCSESLVTLTEIRLPDETSDEAGRKCLAVLLGESKGDGPKEGGGAFSGRLAELASGLTAGEREGVASRIRLFLAEIDRKGVAFPYSDCSVGNMIFAGCVLQADRDFNAALRVYCDLLGLPAGMIANVTDGTNAHLVAVDSGGRVLAREAEIVDSAGRVRIRDLFLLDHEITDEERANLLGASPMEKDDFLRRHSRVAPPNPRVLEALEQADLIVYSPGTQHSSLFPSYLVPGVGDAIAKNLRAVKLLSTNLEEDADIADASATELIDRAVYYLREKNKWATPTPCLVTHYLLNDPADQSEQSAYVPLGSIESFEDPRLVRIGNYEDAVSGRHDAEEVLKPYVEALLGGAPDGKVAVRLLMADRPEKIAQTLVEMVRAGIEELPFTIDVFHDSEQSFADTFRATLPFGLRNLHDEGPGDTRRFFDLAVREGYDYVVLFESSGMYKGEDVVNILEHFRTGRLDAVWGSRRLSINDIHMAYHLLHRNTPIRGAISYLGSHLLSLTFLLLYGRYISDSISGARAVRTAYLKECRIRPEEPGLNFELLSVLLRNRAEVIETPVHYFPISPQKVRRTRVTEGLRGLWTIFSHRFRRLRHRVDGTATVDSRRIGAILPEEIDTLAKNDEAGRTSCRI